MTEQSNHQPQEIINLRDKGVKNNQGRLFKGCVQNATTKLCIGSIPSTYQSIIYRAQSKKAFGTSQKRWTDKISLETTKSKIASTSVPSKQAQPIPINVSHSKQGYGPFLSKDKRQWMRLVKTPGPGKYNVRDREKPLIQRKCVTRKQRKVHSKKRDSEEIQSPGPATYEYEKCNFATTVNTGFKSSFETKVKRDGYIPKRKTPGPGTYIQPQKKQEVKKEKSNKQKNVKDNKTLLDLIKEQSYQEPGPGWYQHEIPTFKPIYEKIKMSRNFMSPLNNQNKVQGQKTGPASTLYQIKRMYDNEAQELINWACFMSETKRDPFKQTLIQGPNLKPLAEKSQNFHFNIKNYWL